MEAWEYRNQNYQIDMKYNLTADNLDNLIEENGLCLGYTHFGFNESPINSAFFKIMSNGDYEIKEEVNDLLEVLDYYQNYRGLWIDTVENVFDRMLAIEKVQIVSVSDSEYQGYSSITIENNSDFDLKDLKYSYEGLSETVDLFKAHTQITFQTKINNSPEGDLELPTYVVSYLDRSIYINNKNSRTIPPVKVAVYNIKGQLVSSSQSYARQSYIIIPFNQKASGVYLVRIKSSDFKTKTMLINVVN
jgi:hypothetical protein